MRKVRSSAWGVLFWSSRVAPMETVGRHWPWELKRRVGVKGTDSGVFGT